ncbi:ATP-binding protein [Massilia sp. ST3]|uniref:hybrid sensor histidine kinase/response regulator n=1 Tax=Massilia sp. ST3 TaxID=2824903 RepID=UPI001B82A2C2|nr:ATP-binding protein [Massilia sp. ST3]MBQ5946990.1 response regulator [Massilia sp. ST3]
MSIRLRLILLIASVLLPAFAAGAIAVWFVYAEEQGAQERSLSEAARVLAQLVDNELRNSASILQALSTSPDLANGNLERFYSHARTLSADGRNPIILSDLQGRQILNTRLPFGTAGRTINGRLFELRQQAGPRRPLVSDLFFSALGQRHEFAIQAPVFVQGELRHYLSRRMEAKELQRFLGQQGFPDKWITSVVDRQGTVIARSAHFEQFIGKRATGELARKIAAGMAQGTNDGVSLDGTPVKAFFYRAPMSEWTIILSVPVAELNRPALRASLLLSALFLLTLAVALALTQRYLKRTLAPVHRLRDDARRLGHGDTVTPFASGLAELDVVNATLVRASGELRAANANMERRVAEAIESTERAQRALLHSQKLEALGRLTGGVAHDFNNVLQTLTAALQLIAIEANPARLPDRIAVCKRAVDRAAALVAQLRAFGRTQDAYLQTVRADEAVSSALPMLRNSLPSAIRLDTAIASGAWPVRIDLTQFELALLNLVLNARDAIEGQGLITIRVDNHHELGEGANGPGPVPAGEYVRIEIADTGTGMTPEVLAKACDPFYTTKPVDKGSGLGLPQAYGFATQSHGTLVLRSAVGAGTTASLYLPRAAPGAATQPVQSSRDQAQASPGLAATVLFVEDDSLVRESVMPILEQAGAEVLCARNAEDALRLLEAGHQVDILFTDIVMPGKLNGVMLAKQVRERYPHIALVLATGYVEERFELPEATLLTKPYQASDAIEALRRAILAGTGGHKPLTAPATS